MLAALQLAGAQSLILPETIQAGAAFDVQTSGSGNGTLYIVGPSQVLQQKVTLGQTASFDSGTLTNAGIYTVILTGGTSTEHRTLNVLPAKDAAHITFLARPSRLPVNLHNGISGAVYVFDAYHNLIIKPMPVFFDLTPPSGAAQQRKATTVD